MHSAPSEDSPAEKEIIVTAADRKRRPGLATAAFILAITFLLSFQVYELRDPDTHIALALIPSMMLPFPIVGWLIAVRQGGNPLGWVYLLFPTIIGIGSVIDELALGMGRDGSPVAVGLLLSVGSLISFLGYWLMFGPGIALFPDGRHIYPAFRQAMLVLAALIVGWAMLFASGSKTFCLVPFGEPTDPCPAYIENALVVEPVAGLGGFIEALPVAIFFLTLSHSLASITVRYRLADREVRQQIKWVVWMAAASVVIIVILFLISDVLGLIVRAWGDFLTLLPLTIGFPAAIGVAIFRYRLYDIDRVISRTLSYSILTGTLLAVYFGSVTFLQTFLPNNAPITTVVSTLVIAAIFNPLRLRLQDAIDRRFHRRKYDAERILAVFAANARDEVNLDSLAQSVMTTVHDTIQPEFTSLWIRDLNHTE